MLLNSISSANIPAFARLKPNDASSLSKAASEIYRQHYADLWLDGGDQYVSEAFSLEQILAELTDELNHYFSIELENQRVGFLKVVVSSENDQQNGLYLERIYLNAAQTGKGLGQQSLNFVDKLAKRLEMRRIWLQAMAYRQDVCRFYKRFGYIDCGVTILPGRNVVPGREKMLVMEKTGF